MQCRDGRSGSARTNCAFFSSDGPLIKPTVIGAVGDGTRTLPGVPVIMSAASQEGSAQLPFAVRQYADARVAKIGSESAIAEAGTVGAAPKIDGVPIVASSPVLNPNCK